MCRVRCIVFVSMVALVGFTHPWFPSLCGIIQFQFDGLPCQHAFCFMFTSLICDHVLENGASISIIIVIDCHQSNAERVLPLTRFVFGIVGVSFLSMLGRYDVKPDPNTSVDNPVGGFPSPNSGLVGVWFECSGILLVPTTQTWPNVGSLFFCDNFHFSVSVGICMFHLAFCLHWFNVFLFPICLFRRPNKTEPNSLYPMLRTLHLVSERALHKCARRQLGKGRFGFD